MREREKKKKKWESVCVSWGGERGGEESRGGCGRLKDIGEGEEEMRNVEVREVGWGR